MACRAAAPSDVGSMTGVAGGVGRYGGPSVGRGRARGCGAAARSPLSRRCFAGSKPQIPGPISGPPSAQGHRMSVSMESQTGDTPVSRCPPPPLQPLPLCHGACNRNLLGINNRGRCNNTCC